MQARHSIRLIELPDDRLDPRWESAHISAFNATATNEVAHEYSKVDTTRSARPFTPGNR